MVWVGTHGGRRVCHLGWGRCKPARKKTPCIDTIGVGGWGFSLAEDSLGSRIHVVWTSRRKGAWMDGMDGLRRIGLVMRCMPAGRRAEHVIAALLRFGL